MPKPSPQLNLPNTAYAVLGILSFGEPLSGYEIRKWTEHLHYFYWRPAQSQIYAELRRLAKLNLVRDEYIPQEGKPDKRVYRINEAGQAAFKAWLNHEPLEEMVIKHPLMVRLFFSHAADRDDLLRHIESYKADIQEALAQLYIVEEFAESGDAFASMGLVALWGQNFYKAELATAEALLQRLGSADPDQ